MYHECCVFTMSFHGLLVLSLGQGLWQQCLHGFLFYTRASAAGVSAGAHSQKTLIVSDMFPHGLFP